MGLKDSASGKREGAYSCSGRGYDVRKDTRVLMLMLVSSMEREERSSKVLGDGLDSRPSRAVCPLGGLLCC